MGLRDSRISGNKDAAPVNHPNTFANERNVGTSNEYGVGVDECNATRLDIGTTETLVSAVPCIVFGIIGNDGNTGYTDLIDAAAIASGNTPVMRVNVEDAATKNAFIDCKGAKFNTGICVDGQNAAHDVTILWRPQN